MRDASVAEPPAAAPPVAAASAIGVHAATAHRDTRRRDADERPLGLVRDVLVVVVAIIGAATVLWLAAAAVFGLHLTVLATGSMSPGMPPGTLVVTRSTPATQLKVGDVVTVPRELDGKPVTHRIVQLSAGPNANERDLRLKGDANTAEDTATYIVGPHTPRRIASVPGIGRGLLWLQRPIVAIVSGLVVAAIVAWALWPASGGRGSGGSRRRGSGARRSADRGTSVTSPAQHQA
ncbi:signal peptidase I [Gryllotalpicola reticulitermitis]|uniref:Signal peptidase I n=1 Tax=Gryllotalpicola reticulitermitis TaxID=1184153 RepID=A0ABV8Q824_9MICO